MSEQSWKELLFESTIDVNKAAHRPMPDIAGYMRFRSLLENANDPELMPIQWLDTQVLEGRGWPIIGERSAMVVELQVFPGGARVVHVRAGAGDLRELIEVLAPRGEQWGRELGCRYAMIEGRAGWARALKDYGWKLEHVTLRKDL